MKKLFFVALFALTTFTVFAQMPYPGKENQHTIYGGEDGKNFAAIFDGDFSSRQEAISHVITFLGHFGFIEDEQKAMDALKEYDDTQSEISFPIYFRFGWHPTAPLMGAVAVKPPFFLKSDLLFQFYDNGKVRATIKNLSEYAFSDYVWISKSLIKEKDRLVDNILTQDERDRYEAYVGAVTMTAGMGKAIGAFLAYANKGADKIKEFEDALGDFLKNIDEQIDLAQTLVVKDYYIFGSSEELVKTYREMAEKGDLSTPLSGVEALEKELAEGKLIQVYDFIWKRDIKQEFDYVFLALSACFNGNIEAIAEDGEVTWQKEGDALLPVDAKLKKKLQKAGKDYFSYYGN